MPNDIIDLQRRAVEARDTGELLDFGTCKAQTSGESLYGLLPSRGAEWLDVKPGTELHIGVDLRTRSFVLTVVDVDDQEARTEQLAEA